MNKNIVAFIFGISIVLGAFLVSNAFSSRYKTEDVVTVTGLADKDFESDLINWSASYSRKSLDLKEAFAQLKADEQIVKAYLVSKGITEKELLFSAVDVQRTHEDKFDQSGRMTGSVFTGFQLTQTVSIESKRIDAVETVSRDVTSLIEKGIIINSFPPSYYYSKLSELKIDLLSEAASDAKQRAETIAKSAGGGLGKLKKANMGVFQITGKNSNENYETGGTFNTSSRIKTATITVKTEYKIR